MARRALNHGRVVWHAGLLGGLRDVVDIGTERDDWFSLPPGGHERRRDARYSTLNLEAFFFEDGGEVTRGFDLLETQFAEAEDAVHHHLHGLLHGVDLAHEIRLHAGCSFRRNLILRKGT